MPNVSFQASGQYAPQPRGLRGLIRGPGTGTSDSIKTQAAPGTFVMPADSTQRIGPEALSSMGAQLSSMSAPRGLRGFKPGAGVPVALSDGEFAVPPEQLQAIGGQVLEQMKNATHAPTARGFAPGARAAAQQTPEPRYFFANGTDEDGVPDPVNQIPLGGNVHPARAAPPASDLIPEGGSTSPTSPVSPVTPGSVTDASRVTLGAGAGRGLINPTTSPSPQPDTTPPVGPTAQPVRGLPGIYRNGSSYSDTPDGAQPQVRGLPVGWSTGEILSNLENRDSGGARGLAIGPSAAAQSMARESAIYQDINNQAAAEGNAARAAAAQYMDWQDRQQQREKQDRQLHDLMTAPTNGMSRTDRKLRAAMVQSLMEQQGRADVAQGQNATTLATTQMNNAGALQRTNVGEAGADGRALLAQQGESSRALLSEQGHDRRDRLQLAIAEIQARKQGAPAGYRFSADGTRLEVIPGGPADPGVKAANGKPLPPTAAAGILTNRDNLRRAQTALALLNGQTQDGVQGDSSATGVKGYLPNSILNRVDPAGTSTRGAIADIGSMVLHDRSGAAITAAEMPRLAPFIPSATDDPATAKKKLSQFAANFKALSDDASNFYRDQGYFVPEERQSAPAGQQDTPTAQHPEDIQALLRKYGGQQ